MHDRVGLGLFVPRFPPSTGLPGVSALDVLALGAPVAAELAGFEDVLVAVVAVVLVMVALTAAGAAIEVLGVVAAAEVVIAVFVVICFAAAF